MRTRVLDWLTLGIVFRNSGRKGGSENESKESAQTKQRGEREADQRVCAAATNMTKCAWTEPTDCSRSLFQVFALTAPTSRVPSAESRNFILCQVCFREQSKLHLEHSRAHVQVYPTS